MRAAGGVTSRKSFIVECRRSSACNGDVTPLLALVDGVVDDVVITLGALDIQEKLDGINSSGVNLPPMFFSVLVSVRIFLLPIPALVDTADQTVRH